MSANRPSPAVSLLLPSLALVVSVVVTTFGALMTVSANTLLTTALASQTGTAAEVYGSQSNIVIGSGLLTAGIVGIVLSLVLFGALVGFGALSRTDAEAAADPLDADYDDDLDLVDEPEARLVPDAPAAAAAATAAAAPAAPVAATAPAAADDVTPTEALAEPVDAPATEAEAGAAPEASDASGDAPKGDASRA
ncbi:hypothetical protein [Agromyces sp. LHK192]|uniref:hypothetical protein n=1 Tax=Agromyces sp. LHK192 TaxID=2498704 RepID=UPI00196B09CB|nr:hypothetical protein [Agromyces sp. LHK192]